MASFVFSLFLLQPKQLELISHLLLFLPKKSKQEVSLASFRLRLMAGSHPPPLPPERDPRPTRPNRPTRPSNPPNPPNPPTPRGAGAEPGLRGQVGLGGGQPLRGVQEAQRNDARTRRDAGEGPAAARPGGWMAGGSFPFLNKATKWFSLFSSKFCCCFLFLRGRLSDNIKTRVKYWRVRDNFQPFMVAAAFSFLNMVLGSPFLYLVVIMSLVFCASNVPYVNIDLEVQYYCFQT